MPQKQCRQTRHLPAFILLVVAEAPLHGGGIHTALMERLPGLKPDTGAIYRTLQALEAEGELSFAWDTSNPGPARKVYRLTPKGWERLAVWKGEIEHRLSLLQGFLSAYDRLSHPA
ncbi:MAG: PadR family transcriptional regulator [Humidesulfovibrio sp.]|nr:PadR family transcriptional regulator [Humidesulfovibrio sp.]